LSERNNSHSNKISSTHQHQVCIGLGSNIEPRVNIPRAVAILRKEVNVLAVSNAWETPPVGTSGSNFVNAAALITTSLSPKSLKLNVLRPIEAQLGRVRTYDKYAPRPIDLDIVIYDGELYDPALWIYAYLALPVAEILPDYAQPRTGESLENLAKRISNYVNTRKLDWIL